VKATVLPPQVSDNETDRPDSDQRADAVASHYELAEKHDQQHEARGVLTSVAPEQRLIEPPHLRSTVG
jgi:hypothetical protein